MVRRHEQSLRSFGYGLVFHRVHKLNYNLSSRSTPPIGHQLQLHNNCIISSNEIISVEVRINRKNWQLSKFAYFSADVILKKKKKKKAESAFLELPGHSLKFPKARVKTWYIT